MMRELTEHELELVAGGATAIFVGVANAAMAGAAGAVKPPTPPTPGAGGGERLPPRSSFVGVGVTYPL